MSDSSANSHRMPRLDRIGRRQRGLVTTKQLDEIGMGRAAREKAASAGRLTRVRRGVYLLPGVQPTWETTVLAAVLAAGPGAVASHWTAARVWDLFDNLPPDAATLSVHVTAPRERRLEGAAVHRRQLDGRECARRRDVPVTSVARTLFDLASVMDAENLGRCTDEALRRGLLNLRELHRLSEAHRGGGRRCLRPLRRVLAERLPGFDPGANDWEQRMDRLWGELGLPAAARQYRVTANGCHYRVDRAIPELRLAVEWVGKEFHGQRGRFARDRIRISNLVLAGWDVIEVTPEWTTSRIRATVLAKVAERQRLLTWRHV
jgi:hypothetical protein